MNSDGDDGFDPNAFCMDLDAHVDMTERDGFSRDEEDDTEEETP